MKKVLVEFIDVCAWCDKYGSFVEGLSELYREYIDLKIYKVGRDFDYLKKYGLFLKSTIVINEEIIIDKLSKEIITEVIECEINKIRS